MGNKSSSDQANRSDKFILEHYRSNNNEITDLQSFDKRRVVFISLIGLFESWKKCPSVILHSSIFLLPLKRKWVYDTEKYQEKLLSHFVTKPDKCQMEELIHLLKWKDSQNLAFWMLDFEIEDTSNDIENENDLICPLWKYFSLQLTNLYDNVTGNNYKPLILDSKWWRNCTFYNQHRSQFNVKAAAILAELFLQAMKFKSIQELIYQSNPLSLNPIIHYG
eukprot:38546_1